jgi:AcrR family transcriptional regulator
VTTSDTKRRLETAVLDTIREDGIAGVSARTVARRARVNQALIFYHYDNVPGLIEAAALASVSEAIERYRSRLAAAASFADLFATAQQLNAAEQAAGNVRVMAQLVAGAPLDPTIAGCARACLNRWIDALQPTIRRLLDAGPLAGLVDADGMTRAVSSAFIGLELYEGVDDLGAASAARSLAQLGAVLEAIDALGPVAGRTIRARLRRRSRRS